MPTSLLVHDRVRLRLATPDDVALLERWREPEFVGEFNRFGLPSRRLRAGAEDTSDGGGTVIVELIAGGTPIGSASWRPVRYGPNAESLAWNIGINLIPAGRGQGYGAEAQRLLVEHLFAATPAKRVEAMTDVDNIAEQRSLEKAGFVREGVLRSAQYRAGRRHDLVVYSTLRPPD